MRHLVAFPILALAVILQSAIVSRISLLSGYADLVLVIVIGWALQEGVTTAWHWAVLAGALGCPAGRIFDRSASRAGFTKKDLAGAFDWDVYRHFRRFPIFAFAFLCCH